MPSLEVDSQGVRPVADFAGLLDALLGHAEEVKPTGTIEPSLSRSDFEDLSTRVGQVFAGLDVRGVDDTEKAKKLRQYAIIETAVRDVFSSLIVCGALCSERAKEKINGNAGYKHNRLAGLRQSMEYFRYPISIIGQRGM